MVKNPLWLFLILSGFVACHEKPVYPVTPEISLNSYDFISGINNNDRDTLVINLKFQDGDGNLGLAATEADSIYRLYDFVVDGQDTLRYGDEGTPAEFNCYDYEIFTKTISVDGSLVVKSDTFYVIRNENHYNYFLDILVKEGDEFVKYNFWERLCSPPLYGRFFILNTIGDKRPLTGELEYKVVSAFRIGFRYDIIKLRIQIQDRALNKSNIIETEEFSIQDI